MRKRAILSWSGGKDCWLAAIRTHEQFDIVGLVTMLNEDGSRSRSHGLRPDILAAQAARLNLPLFTRSASWQSYEDEFADLLLDSSRLGVSHVVFGDIYPESNRLWAERVCCSVGLTATEPIFGESTEALANEFIDAGGSAVLIAVCDRILPQDWLGREFDRAIIEELVAMGIDPCGERGEFHTLVTSGPLFSSELKYKSVDILTHNEYSLLDIVPEN